jgi:hypothetical protein
MNRKKKKEINRTGKRLCPICQGRHILVEHHIAGRKISNPNHPSNLLYCCSNCHREIHEGLIIVEGWFMTTDGKELIWHQAEKESITGTAPKTHIIGQDSQ